MPLRQIAERTRISVMVLEALERDDIKRLPGGIFTRSFLRAYASEVGLDPDSTVDDFLAQFPPESVAAGTIGAEVEDHDAIESDRRAAQTFVRLLAVSLPIAAVVVYFTVRQPPPERVATAPRATPAAGASSKTESPSSASPAVLTTEVKSPAPDVEPLAAAGGETATAGAKSVTEPKPTTPEAKLATTEVKPAATEVKSATAEVKSVTTEVKPAATPVKPTTTEIKSTTTDVKPPAPDVTSAVTDVKAPSPSQPRQDSAQPEAVPDSLMMVIAPSSRCWVAVAVDGEAIPPARLASGERLELRATREIVVTVGEDTPCAYTLNGAAGRPLGKAGAIVTRRISPDNFRNYIGQ
jgi:cytoskeleton protein RodZ